MNYFFDGYLYNRCSFNGNCIVKILGECGLQFFQRFHYSRICIKRVCTRCQVKKHEGTRLSISVWVISIVEFCKLNPCDVLEIYKASLRWVRPHNDSLEILDFADPAVREHVVFEGLDP